MTTIEWITLGCVLVLVAWCLYRNTLLKKELERYKVAADMWKELAISQEKDLDSLVMEMNKALKTHDSN